MRKPNGWWTYERCHIEAKKYMTRSEYQKKCPSYQAAHENGWLDEICSHMSKPIQTKYIIYAYEFSDNHVYVGLTKNKRKRLNEHNSSYRSPVYKYSKKTNLKPKLVILYEQLIFNDNDIKKQEKFWLDTYINDGWIPLNKVKTGGLGGSIIIWSKKKCHKAALTCENRTEFMNKFSGAYHRAHRRGWLDDVCSHMVLRHKPNGYWTYEKCREAAYKCKSVNEFCEKYGSAYTISKNNGWMTDFNVQLNNVGRKKRGYWIKEKCHEEALKYDSRWTFQQSSHSAYCKAFKNGWLDEICSHMELQIKPCGHWNVFENCKEEASKYKTKGKFGRESSGAYHAATRNNWLDEFFPVLYGKCYNV